ncbi:helix-turn-helix domain-containing protein [Anaerocolumna aminovalerica]|uniref:helix-turn-helix domain-containing protein n=1 Tax=Anaerocolumna aminovalerica TaxID=1527 RepID=UPI000BE37020|nr:helix-turn-helix transcriptional regulator [Anaerocolumna aminovalerica]
MNKANQYSCTLLKLERLKQNKGQKEVCYGICVPSYLSKIERNQVTPDSHILKQLFERLDIEFYCEESFMEYYNELIESYFEQMSYHLEKSAYKELQSADKKLSYSPLAIDWLIIQAYEDNKESLKQLSQCLDSMNNKQRAYYYMALPLKKEEEKEIIDLYIQAFNILNNSYSLVKLILAYYRISQYDKVHEYVDKCISLALEEGNTWALGFCYRMVGTVYACLHIEDLMLPAYQRAIHLLQNTYWKEELSEIHYNMGATYLQSGNYSLALKYLNMVTWENDFLLYHKKALVYIRSEKMDVAEEFINAMKNWIKDNEKKGNTIEVEKIMLEEALYECKEDYLDDPNFINIMETLMDRLKSERHKGYVLFYKSILKKAYCRQRKYKKALELFS